MHLLLMSDSSRGEEKSEQRISRVPSYIVASRDKVQEANKCVMRNIDRHAYAVARIEAITENESRSKMDRKGRRCFYPKNGIRWMMKG